MSGTLEIPGIGEKNTTADPKLKTGLETFNNLLEGSNKIPGTSLAAAAAISNAQLAGEIEGAKIKNETIKREDLAPESKPVTWYAPKIIATEETRENVAYGTLTTKDEIASVILPENGLIVIGYQANVKSSVASAGRLAIFIGANQIKVVGTTVPVVQEGGTGGGGFTQASTSANGLTVAGEGTSFVTTGQVLASSLAQGGGFCYVYAAAGTYNISVQYKASSGNVTAKERKLWVYTLGF